jgi:sulfur-oxidizing protein SoxX
MTRAALLLVLLTTPADAQTLVPYQIVGHAIPKPLTGEPGDPVRGRAIVVKRGARWSAGELRLRLVDATRLNPATIMPSYYRIDGLVRVAPNYRGKPALTAQQIEDVVAYLATLKD